MTAPAGHGSKVKMTRVPRTMITAEAMYSTVLSVMGEAVETIVKDDKDGKFDPTPYVGTLENKGVALAPFHDLDASVSADTKAEIAAIQKDIISGALKVTSAASPK